MTSATRCLPLLVVGMLALSACKPEGEVTADAAAPAVTSAVSTRTVAALPMPKACDLLSADEAQAVLAQAAGLMSDDPENCMWASMESPGRITMLMLQVSEADDIAQAQILFDALVGMAGSDGTAAASGGQVTTATGQLLDGLGDAAWLSATSVELIGARQLHVRKGSRLLSLNVTGMANGDLAAQTALAGRLQTLAQSAVAKL